MSILIENDKNNIFQKNGPGPKFQLLMKTKVVALAEKRTEPAGIMRIMTLSTPIHTL